MNPLDHLIPILGWALIHFLWQGALIAALCAFALRCMRRATPQARYNLAALALILCAAFPLSYITVRMQQSDSTLTLKSTTTTAFAQANTALQALISLQEPAETTPSASAQLEAVVHSYAYTLVVFWALGVLLLILRLYLGLLWVRQHRVAAESQVDVLWQTRLQNLAQRLQIKRTIRLGLSSTLESPITVGWWHPIVILPVALVTGMPSDLLEALLAHEIAHIKRFDYLVNLFQSTIEIALFYHPAVWWISKQVRIEREQIADDLAARLLGEPRRLALALSELERFQFFTPQLAQAAHGGNLMSRIKRLIQPELATPTLTWKFTLPIVGICAACAVLVAQAEQNTAITINTPAKPTATLRTKEMPTKENSNFSMALVNSEEDRMTINIGDRKEMKEIQAIKKQNQDEFLWFKEAGKSYLIKDKQVLEQVHAAYKPVDEISAQMEAQGEKMEAQGAKMEVIGREMEKLNFVDDAFDTKIEAHMKKMEKKLIAAQTRLEKASKNMAESHSQDTRLAAQKKLAEAQEQLREAAEELSQEAIQRESKLAQADTQKFIKALDEQMREANAPMEALQKEMDTLDKQLNDINQKAEAQVKDIIQNAKRSGLVILQKIAQKKM